MEFPSLLLALLALPFVIAAVVVAVSSVRRRRHTADHGAEPVHRLQTQTAAVQSARVYPAAVARAVRSGRERRAASAPDRSKG